MLNLEFKSQLSDFLYYLCNTDEGISTKQMQGTLFALLSVSTALQTLYYTEIVTNLLDLGN